MGNFIYIDTDKPDYIQLLKDSMAESLGMALAASSNPKITLVNSTLKQRDITTCDVIYEYPEEEVKQEQIEYDPNQISSLADQADGAGDLRDDEMVNLNRTDWIGITYSSTMICKRSKILDKNLKLELAYQDLYAEGKASIEED